ncbi:MAG: hypothetical protein LBS10_10545 [Gracilibacteraceae bacterium]|nr:hypothetical protein [Gracilibacteraceae bacterium]
MFCQALDRKINNSWPELSKNAEFAQKNRLRGAFSGVFAGKNWKIGLKTVRKLYFPVARRQNLAFLLSSRERNPMKAVRAAKYVENGSRSIMESLLYMVLALPKSLGGYGLSGVEFNHEVVAKDRAKTLPEQARASDLWLLPENRFFIDLYYRREDVFAKNLAACLGRRIQIRSAEFAQQQGRLRELLYSVPQRPACGGGSKNQGTAAAGFDLMA